MAITRPSSGLILRDDFGSDTEANYTLSGGSAASWAVTGGAFVYAATADSRYRRADISTAKCVTCRMQANNAESYCAVGVGGTGVRGVDPLGYSLDYDGATHAYFEKTTADAKTSMTSDASTGLHINTYFYNRVYISGGTIYAKYGESTLSDGLSSVDAAYTEGHVFVCAYKNSKWDWIEARTAQTVTCSGLPANWQFQVTDGTTTVKATASAGTATVDAGTVLFPFTEVMVLDAANAEQMHLLAATLADMGGGDAFAYAADGCPKQYMHLNRLRH